MSLENWCYAWRRNRTLQPGLERAAFDEQSMWQRDSRLTIAFLDGTATEQALVRQHAGEWLRPEIRLKLNYVKEPRDAVIRISFSEPGSWSMVGTTCLNEKDPKTPTMNLGELKNRTKEVARRSILHEFGHAFGLLHEHQNPRNNPIIWNPAAVIATLSGPPHFWPMEDILKNVLQDYADAALLSTAFDAESIMMYEFPARWTCNNVTGRLNNDISKRDRELMHKAYG